MQNLRKVRVPREVSDVLPPEKATPNQCSLFLETKLNQIPRKSNNRRSQIDDIQAHLKIGEQGKVRVVKVDNLLKL